MYIYKALYGCILIYAVFYYCFSFRFPLLHCCMSLRDTLDFFNLDLLFCKIS